MNVLDVRAAYEAEESKEEGLIAAAKLFDKKADTIAKATVIITCLLYSLLDQDRYPEAGTLLWGEKRWNCKPNSVKRIHKFFKSTAKGIVLGGSSLGKSYTIIGMLLLDWIRDPKWTTVKIISTSASHAKANAFSTLVRFHSDAIIPLPGNQLDGFIGMDSTGDKSGAISVVAIAEGEGGGGKLQGYHPVQRDKPHPVFGDVSRGRLFLDEGEEVAVGAWQGVDNFLGSMDGIETLKVICATNPKNIASPLAMRAAPEGGYESIDIDKDHLWKSSEGWDVLRLDAAFSENVVAKKVVYPSMQTYEGYESLLKRNGGKSPEYYTFARGIYPPSGSIDSIVTGEVISRWRGEFDFTGFTGMTISVDIAVDGRDRCIATILRYGMASKFKPIKGDEIKFPERFCIQIDHQQEIQKGDSKIVGDNIIKYSKILGIKPEDIGVDRTGNGASVHDYIKAILGDDVYGLDFRYPASDIKILADDQETPIEAYDGVVTEVWFAIKKYLQAGSLAFGPGLIMDDLRAELIGRSYKVGSGKRLKVEDKLEFKRRYRKSPDYADSLTVGVHHIRMKRIDMPTITGVKKEAPKTSQIQTWEIPDFGSVDVL